MVNRIVALMLAGGLLAVADVRGVSAQAPPLYGAVVSVDTETWEVIVAAAGERAQPGVEVVVPTDENTKVIIDSRTATVADLRPGMRVKVFGEGETAEFIQGHVPIPAWPPSE
jgi:hypothetical protein